MRESEGGKVFGIIAAFSHPPPIPSQEELGFPSAPPPLESAMMDRSKVATSVLMRSLEIWGKKVPKSWDFSFPT